MGRRWKIKVKQILTCSDKISQTFNQNSCTTGGKENSNQDVSTGNKGASCLGITNWRDIGSDHNNGGVYSQKEGPPCTVVSKMIMFTSRKSFIQ